MLSECFQGPPPWPWAACCNAWPACCVYFYHFAIFSLPSFTVPELAEAPSQPVLWQAAFPAMPICGVCFGLVCFRFFYFPRVIIAAYAWNFPSMTCLIIRFFSHTDMTGGIAAFLQSWPVTLPIIYLWMNCWRITKKNRFHRTVSEKYQDFNSSSAHRFFYFFPTKSIQSITKSEKQINICILHQR